CAYFYGSSYWYFDVW
nr:immunoglobulin heavy chain junction region [Mus musculus]